MQWFLYQLRWAWALLGWLALPCLGSAANLNVEFLYLNASEGTASGGHAAIKFGEDVFHFQHIEPGLLRIRRESFPDFRFAYGYQENRAIQGHRIAVSSHTFHRLHDAFKRKLLVQSLHFAQLGHLAEDRRLLAGLRHIAVSGTAQHQPGLALAGLGYFAEAYQADADAYRLTAGVTEKSPPLAQLKQALAEKYGPGFLAEKRQRLWRQLQALKPVPPMPVDDLAEDRFQPNSPSFSEQYRHALLNLAALDVLAAERPVRPHALLTLGLPAGILTDQASRRLQHFQQALFDDLIALMQSQRGDWGYPLLVGMARLQALAQSVAQNRWVVLDRSSPVSRTQETLPGIGTHRVPAAAFAEQALHTVTRELTDLDEQRYGEIEISATVWRYAVLRSGTVAWLHIANTPAAAATTALVRLPLTVAELDLQERVLARHSQALEDKLQAWYRYQLLSRNCVTEIFRVINSALEGQRESGTGAAGAGPVSQRLLGGYVDTQGLRFIPFAAFDAVAKHYRRQSSYRLPSYREQEIARKYLTANNTLVDLAESNVLTASIYRWHSGDSAFLFFTQEAVWLRPVLGSANLTVALGQSLYGMLLLPWDWGDNLKKGLRGVAVSLPELLFFSIRKGSFPGLMPQGPMP